MKKERMTMKTTLDIDEGVDKEFKVCTTIGIAPKDHENVIIKIVSSGIFGDKTQYFIMRKDIFAKAYATMVEYEDNTKEARR